MAAPISTASLLSQLETVCQEHPWAQKIVLVPRVQLGRALEDGLAQRAGRWAGLRTQIPRHLAEQVARQAIAASGRTELPVGGQSFLIASLLQDLDGELPGDTSPQQLASTIGTAVRTLRLNGVERSAVQARADDPDAPPTFETVADCYEGYHELLDERNLFDDGLLFTWAAEAVEESPRRVGDAVVAVCDGLDLPARPAAFVKALREASAAFYRLGAPSGAAPDTTAAARFGRVSPPQPASVDTPETQWSFRRAVGARAEVRAVLQEVLEADVPFDAVEIAYTESTPYLSLIADQAERVGVPVTIGPGQPATMTRTGQALQAFLDWITEGFDVEVLVRMLRAGLLRLDRVQADEDGEPMAAHDLATLLAAHRYEAGRTGYARTLTAAREEAEEQLASLPEDGQGADRLHTRRAHLARAQRIVERLLEWAPRRATIQELAGNLQRFLEEVGPVDAPPDTVAEEDRSLDQAARTVFWQKLEGLRTLPFTYRASGRQLAALLRRWVESQYVRAQSPRPGAVHVLPLESAGYGDRPHLHVLGMDGDTFSRAATEPGGLQDADREALHETTDGMVPSAMTPADEALWRATQALARHDGRTTLYSRTFDLESGEERYPSPLFLRLENTVGGDSDPADVAGLRPSAEGLCLQDTDAWLRVTRSQVQESEATTARERLQETYPWVLDGDAARTARTGDTYGEHDGLLSVGDEPSLGLFGNRPMSASRLETLAETPYIYFLRYVLGVEPLEEPALDDEPWLTPLRRGSILHRTFERFMRELDRAPTLDDADRLRAILEDEFDAEAQLVAPRSQVEREAAKRRLRQDIRVFLQAEVAHTKHFTPLAFEHGFGMGPRRRQAGDDAAARLSVGAETLLLRGRIDRVDRGPEGALALWDYKTGRAGRYEEDDPLQDGTHLQWALYAYALEQLWDEPVERSGYFFPTAEELGTRISFRPAQYRSAVEAVLERLGAMARSGSFPMTPDVTKASAWRFRGYDRLVHDLRSRRRELKRKHYPDDRPVPLFFD